MTLRPIDRMLAAIRREAGEELLLETGKPIRIKTGDQTRTILAQDVRPDQVVGLLRDVAPADVSAGLHEDGASSFDYDAPTGPFTIFVSRKGAKLDAHVKPRANAASPGAAAPKPIGVVQLQQKIVEAPKRAPAPVPQPPPEREGSGKIGVLKNLVDRALVSLFGSGGTDLHLVAGVEPRMRKDGALVELPGFPEVIAGDTIRSWLLEIAPEAARSRFEKTSDADFGYEIVGLARFRVSIFRERRGVAGTVRAIPAQPKDAEEIGLPGVVRDLAGLPRGLVLVTGPLGSGRTTTLAALVDVVNQTRTDHVLTIEDPVEIVHDSKLAIVTQRELRSHAEGWSAALRSALKNDPDVLVVSDLRDPDALMLALEIAESGALVLGGLGVPTAAGAVERILDLVPPERQAIARVMLAESLKGVVAQTLCKRTGGGRVAAFEVLLGTPPVQNAIREGKLFQLPALMQQSRQFGMRSLNEALLELVAEGSVSAEEAYHRAVDKPSIQPALERLLQARAG